MIYGGTDISKCFRESLGFRDNESRLKFCIPIRCNASITEYCNTSYMYASETKTKFGLRNLVATLHAIVDPVKRYIIR